MDKLPTVQELIRLAQEDPEKLNEIQQRESNKIINNCKSEANRRRLEGIMFKINMIKEKNKNRQDKVNLELYNMMLDSFHNLNNSLNSFNKNEKNSHLKIVKKDR